MSETFRARPISRKDIRNYVYKLKKLFGLENQRYFPILPFAENVLPHLFSDYQFEVVPAQEMGNKHGETFPSYKLIRIREDVYEGAARENGRDRFTVAHEVGHLLLHCENDISLCRLDPSSRLKTYEDPEWQANAFGGELLASSWLISGMSAAQVSQECAVSFSAAEIQLRTLLK